MAALETGSPARTEESPAGEQRGREGAPLLSLVVATYQRPKSVARLLLDLDRQTLPADAFEVIVIDDGSSPPVAPALQDLSTRFRLVARDQPNAGPAAARHAAAQIARGDVLLFLDDDMEPLPRLVEEHLLAHQRVPRAVVQGRILADPAVDRLPLFERFHAARLDEAFDRLAEGKVKLRGQNICTGNLSLRRADYLASGGFDASFDRSEDAELGLRLEKAGVQMVYADGARAVHRSDHGSLKAWLSRAFRYGNAEYRVARKHAWAAHADPFRYFFSLAPSRRPFLAVSALFPRLTAPLPRLAMAGAAALDTVGLSGAAIRLTGLAYAAEHHRGMGTLLGSSRGVVRALGDFLVKAARDPASVENVPATLRAAARAAADFHDDVEARHHGEHKYAAGHPPPTAPELIEKIGLQMALGIRVMQLFREAGIPIGGKIVSRLMRHLYACDVHWDAEIAPGLTIAHGMGLAIAAGTRIGPGCILSHGVSLGMGILPDTREQGAPTLQADVHVGPNAIILGPITIGAGTKVMPAALVLRSVPPRSLVETPPPTVKPRKPMVGVVA